jgi:broad specificity phosphatase PhoE
MLCLLMGFPPDRYWQFHLAPASISQVSLYPEGSILNLWNDTSHLGASGQ